MSENKDTLKDENLEDDDILEDKHMFEDNDIFEKLDILEDKSLLKDKFILKVGVTFESTDILKYEERGYLKTRIFGRRRYVRRQDYYGR